GTAVPAAPAPRLRAAAVRRAGRQRVLPRQGAPLRRAGRSAGARRRQPRPAAVAAAHEPLRLRAEGRLMLRNLAYSAASSATAALLLILMIVAGRVLGEVEFGKFTFALMLGGLFETLMDFGLHQVTVRAVARDRSSATDLLHHTLAIKLVWA